MSQFGAFVARSGGAALGTPDFFFSGRDAGRVTSGSPARYDSIPNAGMAGGNVVPLLGGASRPLLSSWGVDPNVTPYFDTTAAAFGSSLPGSACSYLGASSVELVDATTYVRFYVDAGAAADGTLLVTQTNGTNQGFWLRREGGDIVFSVSGAGTATTLNGGALAVNHVYDVVVTKIASGSGMSAYELFLAQDGGALVSLATGSKTNHGTDASLNPLQIGGGVASLQGAFPLVRIDKGVAANSTQRAMLLEQGRTLFAA